jgi:hypothetical protein
VTEFENCYKLLREFENCHKLVRKFELNYIKFSNIISNMSEILVREYEVCHKLERELKFVFNYRRNCKNGHCVFGQSLVTVILQLRRLYSVAICVE